MGSQPSRAMIVPLIVACALFMQNIDSTVIATALPVMARSLNEDPVRLNLAITSYLLSLAVFIPLSGWTADRFGARTVFRASMVFFCLSSIGCGFSNSLPELVVGRILQGMAGAMMVPVGRLVLLRTVPKGDLLRAMAFVSVPAMLGPVIGPPLGGLIVTYATWRWIFFINVPIALVGVVLISLYVENIRETQAGPLDARGFVLSGLGLATLMFGFETVGRGALPGTLIGGLLAVGVICIALYGLHARRTAYPIIDLGLMRIPTFKASTLGGSIFRVGLGGMPFLLPMMLQLGFGLSPMASGLLTFASAAGAITMRITANPVIRAFGFRRVLIGNTVVAVLFLFGYAMFRPTTPHAVIFVTLLAGGFFRSILFTGTNTLAYADVPPPFMSRATSFWSMAQQLSQSLGVATGALLLHITLVLKGGTTLGASDFAPAFIAVALISLTSIIFYLPLPPEAGAELSGHRPGVSRGSAA